MGHKGKNKFGLRLEDFSSYEEYRKALARKCSLSRSQRPDVKASRRDRYRALNPEKLSEVNTVRRQYRKYNPDKFSNEKYRIYNVKSKFGLSKEEYLALQKRCNICDNFGVFGNKMNDLVIDHSHETGKFRGVLCRRHNLGISYFGDEPKILLSAAHYLTPVNEFEPYTFIA